MAQKQRGKPTAYSRGSRANARQQRPRPKATTRQAVRRRLTLLGAVVALVVVVAGVGYLLFSSIGQASAAPGEAIADEGRAHVEVGTAIQYRHYPPASGPHYPSPQPWGVNQSEVAEGYWVHNLEHGGVVLLYKCQGSDCAALASQVTAVYQMLPASKWGNVKFLATPYTKMAAPFTLVAWDRQETLDTLDAAKIQAFYRAYVDRGPEDVS